MIEVVGNLWTYPAAYRVVTTNGSVRKDGAAVMDRGCAKEAATKYPFLAHELGERLQRGGTVMQFFSRYSLFTFPVKDEWDQRARPSLIEQSVTELRLLIKSIDDQALYVLPRPGCGNGGLSWTTVQLLLTALPDNVHVIDFGPVTPLKRRRS